MRIFKILLSACALCPLNAVEAKTYTFDASLLKGAGKHADLSLLEQGLQEPGIYRVNIMLNQTQVDIADVRFFSGPDSHGVLSLQPCLTRETLRGYGVNIENYTLETIGTSGCTDLSGIPHAAATFDFTAQTLNLSIPQVALSVPLTGIAPETLWDEGINALMLDYRADFTRARYSGGRGDTRSFLQLQPGANIGPWRLRSQMTLHQTGRQSEWQRGWTYAERGLNGIRSRLRLGESFTDADIFDGLPLRGVFLSSDERMLSLSEYSYAPVIRGIARSMARVEVRQQGFLIYSLAVAPGPFALTNLFATSGGDLEVAILESDGHPQYFTVPYQSASIAVREGYLKYSLAAGQYRHPHPQTAGHYLLQGSAIYGLTGNLTSYAGARLSRPYQAFSAGAGVSLGAWGALSLDTTWASARAASGEQDHGYQIRARYNKQLPATDSAFALMVSGFSARYRRPEGALGAYHDGALWRASRDAPVSRASVTLGQGIGQWGRFTLSGFQHNYRNNTRNHGLNAGISIPLGRSRLAVNWLKHKTMWRKHSVNDQIASLWLTVPLSNNSTRLSLRSTTTPGGSARHELGLQGDARNHQLWWDLRHQYGPNKMQESSLQTAWSGAYGRIGGYYYHTSTTRQLGGNIAGGLVAHRDGITAGQSLRENLALIAAPGIAGMRVGGSPGLKTDYRGYTLRSGLSPYQENVITVNPADLPGDAEIAMTDLKVIPTAGAVIKVPFDVRQGARALMRLSRADGSPVPFGAVIRPDNDGRTSGVVGEGGVVYLSGLAQVGALTVVWPGESCAVSWRLPPVKNKAGLYEASYKCQ